jgi:hypothetical protein
VGAPNLLNIQSMKKYITVVNWARNLNDIENQAVIAYTKQQVEGKNRMTYEGRFARWWNTKDAANAFRDWAKELQPNETKQTEVIIYEIESVDLQNLL